MSRISIHRAGCKFFPRKHSRTPADTWFSRLFWSGAQQWAIVILRTDGYAHGRDKICQQWKDSLVTKQTKFFEFYLRHIQGGRESQRSTRLRIMIRQVLFCFLVDLLIPTIIELTHPQDNYILTGATEMQTSISLTSNRKIWISEDLDVLDVRSLFMQVSR